MNPNPDNRNAIAHQRRIKLRNTRRVWSAVTDAPCATIRELCQTSGLAHDTVIRALYRLRSEGYIDFAPGAGRARTIVVPFIVGPFIVGPIRIHQRSPGQ